MAQQARTPRRRHARLQPRQLRGPIRHRPFGISPRVQFNCHRANSPRGVNLRRLRLDEDGNPPIGPQPPPPGVLSSPEPIQPGKTLNRGIGRGAGRKIGTDVAAAFKVLP